MGEAAEKFRKGQRVRFSAKAVRNGVDRMHRPAPRNGVVVGYSRSGGVRVKWQSLKTVYAYHPDFLELVRR